MVRETLGVTIQGVERVACIRRRHDPLMMRLVQVLVDERMVESTMDQVDEEVRKDQEQRELEVVIPAGHVCRLGIQ